jgi:predicted RNase H-like nuclease (RuvC/YqgF family)
VSGESCSECDGDETVIVDGEEVHCATCSLRAENERLRDEVISMRAERDSAQTQCRHLSDRIASNAAERAEIERLRAAGDALAEALNEDMGDTTSGARITFALVEWQEARRDP